MGDFVHQIMGSMHSICTKHLTSMRCQEFICGTSLIMVLVEVKQMPARMAKVNPRATKA